MGMENRPERRFSTIGFVSASLMAAGAYLASLGYHGQESLDRTLRQEAQSQCDAAMAGVPLAEDIAGVRIKEGFLNKCVDDLFVGMKRFPENQRGRVLNLAEMGGGILAVVYGIAGFFAFRNSSPLPRGHGGFI